MSAPSPIEDNFRHILMRNILLPIGMGVASAALFVGLLLNLLSTMNKVEQSERIIGNANEISKLMVDMETGMRGFLITGQENFLSPYRLAKTKVGPEVEALIKQMENQPAQVIRLKQIKAQQALWDSFASDMIESRRKGLDVTDAILSERGKQVFDEIRREVTDFLAIEQSRRKENQDSARNATIYSMVIYLLFVLGFGGFLAYNGRRELIKLSSSYEDALQKQRLHAEVLEKQAWLRTGETELASLGIGQYALPQLGKTTLEFLSRYIGITVGALYVRQHAGELDRTATYGFSKAYEDQGQVIREGEGLVGQAVVERRTLHISDVPADYIKVNSGLGETRPWNIIVVPIVNEGRVNGAMELAFLRALRPQDFELLQLITETLGTSIDAALSRQRLQEVLNETQQLNEELQVQQEELRTANEELEEQSRVLEESQSTLENQKAELEQTNEQLAVQTLALDQRNTALKEIQDQLQERARDLERASRYKSEFLANMSHELRTPLNSSLILAKLLADNGKGNLDGEQVRYAQTIYSAGNDLLNLINDILDLSKVEAGQLEMAPEDLPLQRLLDGIKSLFEPLAAQKKLEFVVQVAPDVPQTLHTDRLRLEQVLKNMLSNAIKFTDKGSVTLRIRQSEPGQLAFEVQDSGIGIAAEFHETIFAPFQQVDGTSSRRYSGTGLGLSISRNLAAMLGGTITLRSALGKGSTFTLTVPVHWTPTIVREAPVHQASSFTPIVAPAQIEEASALPQDVVAAAQALGPLFPDDRSSLATGARTVLVVEDDADFAHILYDLAHEMRYQCLVALVAEEGLQLAQQYLPDAILLDMRLPDRSGLSVLQQLKENPQTRHIPVHAISAADYVETALTLGAIGYAIKPTTRDALKEIFLRLEEKLTQKIKRVLLVEDDARQRDSVMELIADPDVEITAVGFGEEALRLLKDTVYDCMIIDLKLPDMMGNELLQRMSTEDICAFPPVIVYTGRSLSREEEADLLKYSRSIIIKGARSPERLLDEVTLFLHKVESELSSERQNMLKTVRSRERIFDGRKILVVDDDVRNIFALTSALEQKGMAVEVARNGLEAISKLNEVSDIDLVLMDVMMPGMDGLEATRRIRQDPRFMRLPIIAITAKAMKDDQEQCIKAGMSDYLSKPVDLMRLQSLLRVWMPAEFNAES